MTVALLIEVRNEADSIADYVRYHLARGFAGVVVADRGSTDGTFDIVRGLARTAPVVVVDHTLEPLTAERASRRMERLAQRSFGATWVFRGHIDLWYAAACDPIDSVIADAGADVERLSLPTVPITQSDGDGSAFPTLRGPADPTVRVVVERIDASQTDPVDVDTNTAVVAVLEPDSATARRRAIAAGIEHHLDIRGQLAASSRWMAGFRAQIEGHEPGQDVGDPIVEDTTLRDHRRWSADAADVVADSRSDGSDGTSLIVVTGMHRSGTSMIARIVNLLGVDIGSEDALMEPKEDNPTGFWENTSFASLDDDLLALLGGAWNRPPVVDDDWALDPGLDEVRSTAAAVVSETFQEPVGLVKDPRLSLTLAFWETVVPVSAVIVAVRDPVEVAASLARRDAMDAEQAASLWIDYTASALFGAVTPIIVDYGTALADPLAAASDIALALGIEDPSAEASAAITAFADPSLRHRAAMNVPQTGPAMQRAVRLYEAVIGGSQARIDAYLEAWLQRRREQAIAGFQRRLEHEWAVGRSEISELVRDRAKLLEMVAAHSAEVDALRRRHQLQDEEIDRLRGRHQLQDEEIDRLRRRHQLQDEEIADLERRLVAAVARADEAEEAKQQIEDETLVRSLRRKISARGDGAS